MEQNKEIRTIPVELELRKDGNNNTVVTGRCAVYNSRSQPLGSWMKYTEVIEPGFFSSVLDNDVVATVEHDDRALVGRTSSGTLKLADTGEALTTENTLPNTTIGNDLRELLKRGDIRGMSFAFKVKSNGDDWAEDQTTGAVTRTLKAGGCERLYDVTYTCNPAYTDTSVAMRSLEKRNADKAEKTDPPAKTHDTIKENERKRLLQLAQIK